MSEPKLRKTRYKTTNWPAYNAALKARGSLTILFDKDMLCYAPASGRRGRQQVFSDAASQPRSSGGNSPRKNAQAWKAYLVGAAMRNEALAACHRLGCSIWKKWSAYPRRSLEETKMHCFKRLGERVMARTFERQAMQLHVRVALLKRFTQLGRPTAMPVASMA